MPTAQLGPASYQAFGCTLVSDLPLAELEPAPPACASVRISIERGRIDDRPTDFDDDGFAYARIAGAPCHAVRGTGAFLVRRNTIVVDADPDATPDLLRVAILGPVMALALEQHGYHCLHGSAVEIEGRAVGFIGPHGAGKSTMACLLHALGQTFLSDDLIALDQTSEIVRIIPGFPRAKLWPDALAALDRVEDSLPRVHPQFDKRSVTIDQRFNSSSLPLERLYVLWRGDEIAIEPVSATNSLETLLGNWYPARFGANFLEEYGAATLFRRSSNLARQIPVRKLSRPPEDEGRLDQAREILSLIRSDLALESGA